MALKPTLAHVWTKTMITINGLTERQKQLVDLMWNCRDLDQVNTLINALPTKQDRVDCRSLCTILIQETLEQEEGLDAYADAAQAAIAAAMR